MVDLNILIETKKSATHRGLDMKNCILVILICICGCKPANRITEHKIALECRDSWQYSDLNRMDTIKILIIEEPRAYCLRRSSWFVIGYNRTDTFGVISSKVPSIKVGDKVQICPVTLSAIERELMYDMTMVYNSKLKNSILCKVKKVYYATITEKIP